MIKKKAKFKSYLPKDENGKIKAGPGRGKGTPNKTTAEVKEVLSWAFDTMVDKKGNTGRDRFLAWCNENPTIFYTQMYVKMLPMVVHGKLDIKHEDEQLLATSLVDALSRVIAARRTGGEGVGVIIDNVSAEEPVPQLVVSRKTGTEAA